MSVYPEGIGGTEGMASLTINPGIRWKSVVTFNARPPAAGEQGPVPSVYEAGWAPGLV